jgi:hypothetical protein
MGMFLGIKLPLPRLPPFVEKREAAANILATASPSQEDVAAFHLDR